MKKNKILYGLTGIVALANCGTNNNKKNSTMAKKSDSKKEHIKDIKILEEQRIGKQLTQEEQKKLDNGLEKNNKKFHDPQKQYQEDKDDKKEEKKDDKLDEKKDDKLDEKKDDKSDKEEKKNDKKDDDSDKETADETDKEDNKNIVYGRVGLKNEGNWCYQNAAWQMIMTMVLRDEKFKKAITTESELSELPKLIGNFINGYEKDELKNENNKLEINQLLDVGRKFKSEEDEEKKSYCKHEQQDSSEYFIAILNILDTLNITVNFLDTHINVLKKYKTEYVCEKCNEKQSTKGLITESKIPYFQLNIEDIKDKNTVILKDILSMETEEIMYDTVNCPFCSEKIGKYTEKQLEEFDKEGIKAKKMEELDKLEKKVLVSYKLKKVDGNNIILLDGGDKEIIIKNAELIESNYKIRYQKDNFAYTISKDINKVERSPIYKATLKYNDIQSNKYIIISLNRTKIGKKNETTVNMPIEDNFNDKKYKLVYIGFHDGGLNGGHWYGYALGQKKYKNNQLQEKWIQCNDSSVSEETDENIKNKIPKGCYFLYERQD